MTIQAEFLEFHRDNPKVFEDFKAVALHGISKGKTRMSSKFILELLRWYGKFPATKPGARKFNNNFTSRYARMFVAEFPAHEAIFERREIHTT